MLRIALVFAFALPAFAQEKPAVTFQAKSPAALLSHIREVGQIVGGKEAVDEFEKNLKDFVGEEGLQGLNITQPILGYARLDGKPEETSFVLVVPITNEKDFLALLERIDAKVEEVKDDKGAYMLGGEQFEIPTYFRMTATHAFIALNGTPKTVAAKSLIPVRDLHDESETGLFALHLHPGRADKNYAALATKALDKIAADENLGDTETKWIKGLKPMAEMLLAQTERITFRGDIDPSTKMASLDFQLVPKPNSLLALGFAARKPSTNRFAGAADADGMANTVLLSAPAWSKEIREALAASFTDLGNFTKVIFAQGPAANVQPSIGKIIEGMAAAAKDGSLDFVSITTTPDKDGRIANVIALKVNNPAEVDKELRILAQSVADDNAELAKKINMEAAKHAGTAIHTFDLGEYLDKPMRDLLGADAKLAVACGKHAVYIGLGTTAVDTVKLLLDAKPGEAAPVDVAIRPKGFAQSYRSMGLMEGIEKAFGTSDKPLRVAALTATTTAKELHLRAELSLAFIRFAMMVQNAPAPP